MKNQYPFFIAEAWVNHNAKVVLAIQLIEAAKRAWADAVKFQTFKAQQVVTSSGEMAEYQKKNLWVDDSQIKMLEAVEMKYPYFPFLKQYCEERNIVFMSTPHWSFESIDFLESLGMEKIKFGSWDLVSLPLLAHAATLGRPIILGTGMATMDEVREAARVMLDNWATDITFLHCTSNYPCPENEVNLSAMVTMKEEIWKMAPDKISFWYSDHTLWEIVPMLATALWATTIEKHFTLDKTMEGPDHSASAEPHELQHIIASVRRVVDEWLTVDDIKEEFGAERVETILWSSDKKPNPSEVVIMPNVRRSLVAATEIPAWEVITREHLELKRPFSHEEWHMHPREYFSILWKKASHTIAADSHIKPEDIV